MRVTLTIDGTPRSVEVDLAAGTVSVDGTVHAVKVVGATGERVELEIDGEAIAVEGWPEGLDQPLKELSVNGERVTARVETRSARSGTWEPMTATVPSVVPAAPRMSAPVGEIVGDGAVVRPPMPGKVIEVRVREGEPVVAGQVLLVLEAMKMRNDVLAPASGTVRDLRVVAGTNVRARESMLRIDPGKTA